MNTQSYEIKERIEVPCVCVCVCECIPIHRINTIASEIRTVAPNLATRNITIGKRCDNFVLHWHACMESIPIVPFPILVGIDTGRSAPLHLCFKG